MPSDIPKNDEPCIDEKRQRYMRMSMWELLKEAEKARRHCEKRLNKHD